MPITVRLRNETEEAARSALEAGDLLAAGKKLADLVQIYKWIPPSDGTNGWAGAGAAGMKAIECLRQCDDAVELARALRMTAGLRFVGGIEHSALLAESYEISQRIGDQKGIAWCLWQQSNFRTPGGKDPLQLRQQALEIFESIGDASGQAVLHQTMALSFEGIERTNHFLSAARFFSQAGEWDDAGRAYLMALTFYGRTGLQEQRKLVQKAIACFRKTGNRSNLRSCYRRLKKINSRSQRRS